MEGHNVSIDDKDDNRVTLCILFGYHDLIIWVYWAIIIGGLPDIGMGNMPHLYPYYWFILLRLVPFLKIIGTTLQKK